MRLLTQAAAFFRGIEMVSKVSASSSRRYTSTNITTAIDAAAIATETG